MSMNGLGKKGNRALIQVEVKPESADNQTLPFLEDKGSEENSKF